MGSELARITKDSFLQAVAEGAKEMPFAGSVMAVLGGVYRGRTEIKFQTFLQEIGKPLAFGNVEGVVEHIAQNIEEPWMVDGLERGWKAVMETMDPTAKLCVYAMVADYMAQKKPPDRLHRQFGNLFMESDLAILQVILIIADRLIEAENPYAEILWCFDREASPPPQFVCHLVIGNEITPLKPEAREAADSLVRNLFGGPPPNGLLDDHPTSNQFQVMAILCHITPPKLGLWKQMQKYLEPVRTARPAT